MDTEKVFTQAQLDQLSSLCFINRIDDHLRIVSGIKIPANLGRSYNQVLLVLEIFFDEEKIDNMSFNLRNYEFDEIIEVARNIRSNKFILREVDNLLAGYIE